MRVRTLVTRRVKTDRGVDHVPPGSTVDLPEEAAMDSIEAGTAELLTSEPAPSEPGAEGGTTGHDEGGNGDSADPSAQVIGAILDLDTEDASLWSSDGRPKVEALSAVLARKVTAEERDAAWEKVQGD